MNKVYSPRTLLFIPHVLFLTDLDKTAHMSESCQHCVGFAECRVVGGHYVACLCPAGYEGDGKTKGTGCTARATSGMQLIDPLTAVGKPPMSVEFYSL